MRPLLLLIFSLACFCLVPAPSPMQAEPPPIVFGTTNSRDGKYAEPAAMLLKGYRLWESQVNERGGLLGRPVKIVVRNDRSRKSLVRSAYADMIGRLGVDMVLAPYGTPLTLAALEACEKNGHVLVASAASGSQIWRQGAEHVFGVYALADRYFIGFLDLIARHGFTEVSIIFESNPFNRDAAGGAAQWAARFGLDVASSLSIEPGTDELAKAWHQLRLREPRAVIVCSYPPEGYRFLDLMAGTQYRPEALAMTITPVHPDFIRRAGNIADNVFAPSQWEPNKRIPFPGTESFIRSFKALYGKPPTYHAAAGYAACQVLEKAIRSTQSLNQERIRDFIRSLDTVTVIGRFKVDHSGKQVGHNPLIIQWQEGKKQIVYPPRLRTAAPRFKDQRGQTE